MHHAWRRICSLDNCAAFCLTTHSTFPLHISTFVRYFGLRDDYRWRKLHLCIPTIHMFDEQRSTYREIYQFDVGFSGTTRFQNLTRVSMMILVRVCVFGSLFSIHNITHSGVGNEPNEIHWTMHFGPWKSIYAFLSSFWWRRQMCWNHTRKMKMKKKMK